MEHFPSILLQSPLFAGIASQEIPRLLECLGAQHRQIPRGVALVRAGDVMRMLGMVTAGRMQVLKEDVNGRQHLLTELQPPALFAEAFVCAGVPESPVTVVAAQPSAVLLLNYQKLITTCNASCGFHGQLVENMMRLLAQKNLFLNRKLEILSQRTIRARVLLFLQWYSAGTQRFTVPYSREEMADFLCVERSALSAELSKMKAEGLLAYRKNEFTMKAR